MSHVSQKKNTNKLNKLLAQMEGKGKRSNKKGKQSNKQLESKMETVEYR